MKSSALLRFFLAMLDVYIWEPLFWLLVILVLSGMEDLSEGKKGILYVSKKRRLVNAVSQISLAILCFWYYWIRTGGPVGIISM